LVYLIGDSMKTIRRKLAKVSTEEIRTEIEKRELLELGRKDPIQLSNVAQLSIMFYGLDKKDADEVSRLARAGQIEKAVHKLLFESHVVTRGKNILAKKKFEDLSLEDIGEQIKYDMQYDNSTWKVYRLSKRAEELKRLTRTG